LKTRGPLVAALTFALFGTACTIMSGLHLDQATDTTDPGVDGGKPKKDGGSSSGSASSSGSSGGSACSLKHAPNPPAQAAAGADVALVVTLEEIVADNSGPAFGLDLDNLCTCTANAPEACATKVGVTHCDPVDANGTSNGLDNSVSELFKEISGSSENFIADENAKIAQGNSGTIVKVDGYNGAKDDDAITVTVYRSPGRSDGVDFGQVQDWPIATNVSAVSTKGYVTGGTLVAEFATITVPFLYDTRTPAQMQSATLVGTLDLSAAPTMTNALLAGRSDRDELIASTGELISQQFGVALCQGGTLFSGFASKTCDHADLPIDPANDGKGAPCQALSFGLSMNFKPATIGSSTTTSRAPERCSGNIPAKCP
jgi:hypothetical protein